MFYSDCVGCSVDKNSDKWLIISWLVNYDLVVDSIERHLFAAFWRFLLKKSKKSAEKFAGKEKVRIFLSLTLAFSAIWYISRLQTAVMAICSLKIFSGYVVYKPLWWGGLRSGTCLRHYPSQQSWVPLHEVTGDYAARSPPHHNY